MPFFPSFSFLIQNQRTRGQNRFCLGVLVPVGGRGEKMVTEGEYGANTVYTCMQMEKWYLLKLFQEYGEGG
jgi:hypothetical protein